MNPFDDAPIPPQESAEPSQNDSATQPSAPGTPLQEFAPDQIPSEYPPQRDYPEDLRISWSWVHLIVFFVFGFISLIVIQGAFVASLARNHHVAAKDLEKLMVSNPSVLIGSMLIWYAALFLFLYVTLSLLRGHPFWQTLGWRKIKARVGELPKNPLIYFMSGCGLSLLVAIVSAQMKTPDNLPMEELFKYRQTALLFMAMAVLVAPLVEETLFRGYLYPLFARSFGVAPGIAITGVLFGLMHGAQLGWTLGLVSILIFVGIVFTIVRARTGSVFASYLMHLGYNSLISIFAILGTHGFTKLPPGH
jgi:CAAX protease family protein